MPPSDDFDPIQDGESTAILDPADGHDAAVPMLVYPDVPTPEQAGVLKRVAAGECLSAEATGLGIAVSLGGTPLHAAVLAGLITRRLVREREVGTLRSNYDLTAAGRKAARDMCGECDGTGDTDGGDICPACDGTGWVGEG